jgi:hypothetical protein
MADSDTSRKALAAARSRAWLAANHEQINMRRRARYAADPAKYIAQNREGARKSAAKWNAENPIKHVYTKHKSGAKKRGIPFLMTFDEWWAAWDTSGKWPMRGCRTGQYVMARPGDVGPYSADNVKIITHSENIAEGNQNRRKRRHD